MIAVLWLMYVAWDCYSNSGCCTLYTCNGYVASAGVQVDSRAAKRFIRSALWQKEEGQGTSSGQGEGKKKIKLEDSSAEVNHLWIKFYHPLCSISTIIILAVVSILYLHAESLFSWTVHFTLVLYTVYKQCCTFDRVSGVLGFLLGFYIKVAKQGLWKWGGGGGGMQKSQ